MKLTRLCHAQGHGDTFRARTVKAAAGLHLGAEGTCSTASLPERAAAKMEGRSRHLGSDSQANKVQANYNCLHLCYLLLADIFLKGTPFDFSCMVTPGRCSLKAKSPEATRCPFVSLSRQILLKSITTVLCCWRALQNQLFIERISTMQDIPSRGH